ncbi:hypothetical protein PIB30_059070 [Stylosanthes scabra]|uniref:Uncharacterized protein n=1 Tax=Stylosanthes scabra TaxID=79078 RepID=A0ABU6SK64_9FABA|nr:hypothetical protein [Stylosanthes scabra]
MVCSRKSGFIILPFGEAVGPPLWFSYIEYYLEGSKYNFASSSGRVAYGECHHRRAAVPAIIPEKQIASQSRLASGTEPCLQRS